jgi:hypothetical protein
LTRVRGVLWCLACGYEEPSEEVLPVMPMSTRWPPHANPRGEYHSKREREDYDA